MVVSYMEYVENKTISEIQIGDTEFVERHLTSRDIEIFAAISGDVNPTHVDLEYIKHKLNNDMLAHGMWIGAVFSAILGTKLPGPGTVYLKQSLNFENPAKAGDTIKAIVTVIDKDESKNTVKLSCECFNQDNIILAEGLAEVIAPTEKIKTKRIEVPEIMISQKEYDWYQQLIGLKGHTYPLLTAIVNPIDEASLGGAVFSAMEGIIEPILIGNGHKIQTLADKLSLDISKYQIINTETDVESAKHAVHLAKLKQVEAIMKGKIHTDDLMRAIVDKQEGIRTKYRISHVFAMHTPSYHKPLFLTDAAINISPNLAEKKDIVQNAINLFLSLKLGTPKVALLSAVETVNEKIPSTIDATVLCKMSERGQITGGILDGPLAFDNAISKESAEIKGIVSQVAGDADILMVPDIESGNMLYKQMTVLSGMEAAGLVLGAQVPIILTSRSSRQSSRKASCILALMYSRNNNI